MELDPQFADARFHLGTALAETGQWEEAAATYREALTLPRLTVPELAHQNLGLALYHLKRYPEAESSLRFALRLEPKLQAAYYNLGLVLTATERKEEQLRRARREHAPRQPQPGRRAVETERQRERHEGGLAHGGLLVRERGAVGKGAVGKGADGWPRATDRPA